MNVQINNLDLPIKISRAKISILPNALIQLAYPINWHIYRLTLSPVSLSMPTSVIVQLMMAGKVENKEAIGLDGMEYMVCLV